MVEKRLLLATVVAAALLCLASGASGADSVLGTTATNGVLLDGQTVPSGTTVVSPSVIAAGATPALFHLRGGRNVALAEGSQAVLETDPAGGIRLAVETGAMELREPGGAVVRLAANEAYLLLDEETIGEGAEVEMVAICTYDEDQDDWILVQVPSTEVDARLAAGDVRAGKEFNDLGLDEDCEGEGAVPLFTTAGKVVTGLSGVAVLGLLDEDEASP